MRSRERPPVLIRWIARPDACAECKRIAAGSPYERLPTWPGLGDTKCVCRCSVEGTRAGNVMAMAGAAPVETAPIASETEGHATVAADPVSSPVEAITPLAEARAFFGATGPRPSVASFRLGSLERRWALALGALIFFAAFVAIFSTQH